jgi:glycosyltransferase involved in cell wall biosynthesis
MFILRKGPDRFVDIAAKVLAGARRRPVYFVWIGGTSQTEYGRYVLTDVERLGISERFRLVPERIDPRPYLAALDIFMLTSRSDPFPLVCLEAAVQAEAPIVCFDQAGGMPELVGTTCGVVVPYLDTDAAADAILRMVSDPDLRTTLGRQASDTVRAHHDVSRSAPHIAALIQDVLDGGRRSAQVSDLRPAHKPPVAVERAVAEGGG